MPVEKIYVDSLLGTFRNYLKDCKEKNASGAAFDKMKSILASMERMAIELDDINDLSSKLATGQLFLEFSTAYGEVLTELARKEYSGDTGDETLLQQTLAAYENSIQSLQGTPKAGFIIPAIREVIDLGRSGISYPVFLRLCEEKGLNKAMEGSVVILFEIRVSTLFERPHELQKANELLKKYDELAAADPFGIPDITQFGLERIKLDWKYEPAIRRWDAIIQRWGRLIGLLTDWLDSYGSFAPYDTRWVSTAGIAETKKNIWRCKECSPGILKAREKIFYDFFGLTWNDIFSHETFLTERKAKRIWYSDERLELIRETYEHCKPFCNPPSRLIRKAEELHAGKRDMRPGCYQLSEEGRQMFMKAFGQEAYEKAYGNKRDWSGG
jgi:hypothetical protein